MHQYCSVLTDGELDRPNHIFDTLHNLNNSVNENKLTAEAQVRLASEALINTYILAGISRQPV